MKAQAALLLIDLQEEFARRTASGEARSNPGAEAVIARLLARFRSEAWPVVHIRHDDPRPSSAFRCGKPGFAPMACAKERPGEPVFVKTTSGAFASTALADWARGEGVTRFVVLGASVNHCVSSTVRSGFDAGFRMGVVRDGVFGFAALRPGGGTIDPDVVLDVVLCSLAPVLADVIGSDDVTAWVLGQETGGAPGVRSKTIDTGR